MGDSEQKLPPLHARLHWYLLTAAEFVLLKAMVEHCWDGSVLWASLERLAAYSKLSRKQVQRLIHGWTDKRPGKTDKVTLGLVERGILSEIAPANTARRRPATYRLNEAALTIDPRMQGYIDQEKQETIPGIHRPSVPGEPVRPRQKVLPGTKRPSKPAQPSFPALRKTAATTDTVTVAPTDTVSTSATAYLRSPCPETTDTVTPDYLLTSWDGKSFQDAGSSSAFEIVEKRNEPSTTDFPLELAQGLRDLVPDIDDSAIRQIYQVCKANADDCSVEEILHFADSKAFYLSKATNPTGFLIHTVTQCVTREAVITLRDRRQREEQRRQFQEQERRREEIECAARVAEYRRQEELQRRAAEKIDSLPEDERLALKETVAQELFRKTPEARMWPGLREHVRLLMIRRVAEQMA